MNNEEGAEDRKKKEKTFHHSAAMRREIEKEGIADQHCGKGGEWANKNGPFSLFHNIAEA